MHTLQFKPIDELLETESGLPFIHRDISWLSFNYRVLQEAMDLSVPLFERIKFLAIYSSNLDEFFKVRMAYHRYLVRAGKKAKRELEHDPKMTIKEIRRIVNLQQEAYSEVFLDRIVPELKKHQIYLRRRLDLNNKQKAFVEHYFHDHMLPFVQPVLLVGEKVRPFLNNAALYLTLQMKPIHDLEAEDEYALVKIPSDHLPRFIELPSSSGKHELIMLDDIVRHSVSWMFPGYAILDTFSIKLTRDAELYIDDEFSGDLIQKIKDSLSKRQVGPASRFVYDREMPPQMFEFLCKVFELEKNDTLREGRYHNNFDFFKFPDFGLVHLKNNALPPIHYPLIEKSLNIFESIKNRDHLLHYPYQSYASVIHFFEAAAIDPAVTHIKITHYRVAKNSRIMQALTAAVSAGKQVSVFIEVKARFDEEANLNWGEKLEKEGVTVHYSFPGLKVHAKIALVRRQEGETARLYAYTATGNFHEETARTYSDFGLFTADERLTKELARIFSYLETAKPPQQAFKHILVGKFNLREKLEQFIDDEIEAALRGEEAQITLKLNSIQDISMITKLYQASQNGVKIKLIVRGICCLVPGLPGLSENIEAISIVDRFLEHARVFVFHQGGKEAVFLSSADWMLRNLSHRIETAIPIYNEDLKREIINYLTIQLNDNVKARIIDINFLNEYRKTESDLSIRSQLEAYYYARRNTEKLQ
ncbi:MAG: polyphosphate kinase 1 [Bacteroidota bacterium]